METPDERQPRIVDYMSMLGPGPSPLKMTTPEDKEALQALFERVRDFRPVMLSATAVPTVELVQEMKDLIEFAEWTAGKEVPKWHRDILLGMERNAPRMQVVDLMFNIPQAETSEAGKFLTITRSKSREGAADHLAINPTRLRLGDFNKDLK